jgi:lysosomal alpha-mannosidase
LTDLRFRDLLKKDASADIDLNLETCLLANISICEPARSDRFIVTVYNPLERSVNHYVRIPVPDGSYKITGPDGNLLHLLRIKSTLSFIRGSTI